MIIKANTIDGRNAKVFNADGTQVNLLISEYDTETQIAKYYPMGENGKPEVSAEGPVLQEVHLPGSYAEIKGKRC